jgi:predicted TIM-barrel fold metal-dependent hydrolase
MITSIQDRIDAHTHIGVDGARKAYGLPHVCDPDELIELATKNYVKGIIVLPAPGQIYCPNVRTGDGIHGYGIKNVPDTKVVDGKLYFECGQCHTTWNKDDPFADVNKYLFEEAELMNKGGIKAFPIPIVHPKKYKIAEDVKKFSDEYDIKGIKVEGVVDKIDPSEYDKELVDVIKENGLRVLFHTDVVSYSHPRKILEFVRKNDIRAQLAHACWGDEESLRLVRETPRVVTDLGPVQETISTYNKDRSLSKRPLESGEEFVRYVVELAGADKVLASTDYNWCGWTPKSYDREWKIVQKAIEIHKLPGKKIMHDNASEFWGLDE